MRDTNTLSRGLDRLLRVPEVCSLVGMSRSTVYDKMARGEFPKSVRVSARITAWRESDLAAWLRSRQTGGCTFAGKRAA